MSQNEVVCVTTYKRDELLYLCLEAIRRQDSNIDVWAFSDRSHNSYELLSACRKFDCVPYISCSHNLYGNSFGVICAMKMSLYGACGTKPDPQIVHMIEDDTIIHPGYLDWARSMLATGRYAVALGRIPGDPASTWYESPCVSWDAAKLRQCLDLIPPGYLEATTREEMQKILDECPTLKKSRWRFGSAEQDGYFLRCLEYFGWKSAYPEKSLASHCGWWGYNREGGTPPAGNLEERVAQCRKNLNDREFRTRMFGKRITDVEMETWVNI